VLVGSQSSSTSSASGAVVVDDAPYTGTWQDTLAVASTDTTDQISSSYSFLCKLTLSSGGTCSKVRVWDANSTPTGSVKMGLFDNRTPRVRLASASAATIVAGWNEFELSSPVSGLSNGDVVWIGFHAQVDSALEARYLNGGASNTNYKEEAYALFPTSTFSQDGALTRTYVAGAYVY
jgi:hypothetical protein